MEDIRRDYAERRYQTLGLIDGHLHMLIFTLRRGTVHVISLRRANRRERTRHAAQDAQPRVAGRRCARGHGRVVGSKAAGELLKPRRGRPPAENPKEHLNIRLDADIVDAFRRTGSGWQTRLNEALREWLKAHP